MELLSRSVTAICCLSLSLLWAAPLAVAGQGDAGPSFLFATDEAITGTPDQYADGVEAKNLLSSDQWLNAPLTRLDYVLIKMESKGPDIETTAKEIASAFFEKSVMGLTRADFSAHYSREKGRIVIGLRIEAWGKPIQPMQATCKSALDLLEMFYPLERAGYSWSNNALGILVQGGATDYDKIAAMLMDSAVIGVSVTTKYPSTAPQQYDVFQVTCRQQKAGAPVEYFKATHSLQ